MTSACSGRFPARYSSPEAAWEGGPGKWKGKNISGDAAISPEHKEALEELLRQVGRARSHGRWRSTAGGEVPTAAGVFRVAPSWPSSDAVAQSAGPRRGWRR